MFEVEAHFYPIIKDVSDMIKDGGWYKGIPFERRTDGVEISSALLPVLFSHDDRNGGIHRKMSRVGRGSMAHECSMV